MKPLETRTEDGGTLQDPGKASVQIVHDLKNQLNALKLYATFLRRRMEKNERPEDEMETVVKLIAGLDRAANDLSTIVQCGREIELKKQPGFDLQKIMRSICSDLNDRSCPVVCESGTDSLQGNLDPSKLTDALNWISTVALKYRRNDNGTTAITVSVRSAESDPNSALVEWTGLAQIDHDPFRSFAGSDEIRMSLASRIIEAHGGSAQYQDGRFLVTLPLSS